MWPIILLLLILPFTQPFNLRKSFNLPNIARLSTSLSLISAQEAWSSILPHLPSLKTNIVSIPSPPHPSLRPGYTLSPGSSHPFATYDFSGLLYPSPTHLPYSSLGVYVPLSVTILTILSTDTSHPYHAFLSYCLSRVESRESLDLARASTISVSKENHLEVEWQGAQLELPDDLLPLFRSCSSIARDIGVVEGDCIVGEVVGAFNSLTSQEGVVTKVGGKGIMGMGRKAINFGDEKRGVDMGRLGAAEYMLSHWIEEKDEGVGVEVGWGVEEGDRFRDDKEDVLEQEGWGVEESFTMGPSCFKEGSDMLRYLRFVCLGSEDAFLLEPVFRDQIWGFMQEPVSEANELKVYERVEEVCKEGIREIEAVGKGGEGHVEEMARTVRETEAKQLQDMLLYVRREKEAVDLKVYYQERRLKGLGLDSPWSSEEGEGGEFNSGVGLDW